MTNENILRISWNLKLSLNLNLGLAFQNLRLCDVFCLLPVSFFNIGIPWQRSLIAETSLKNKTKLNMKQLTLHFDQIGFHIP